MNRMNFKHLALAAAILFCAMSAQAANLTVVSPGLDSSTSASCPSGCKLSVNMTADTQTAFLISDHPTGETVFRAEFWIFHNNITIPAGETIRIIEIRKAAPAGRILAFAAIYFRNGAYRINFMAFDDTNNVVPVGGFVMSAGGANRFVVEWQAASSMGATDGLVRVSKGSSVKETTTYNYFNGGTGVDQVRFGVVKAPSSSISGSFYLDTYSSFRTLAP